METINLYDVASQAISSRIKNAEETRVKRILLALDPLCPKRAYSKFSKLFATVVMPRSKHVH